MSAGIDSPPVLSEMRTASVNWPDAEIRIADKVERLVPNSATAARQRPLEPWMVFVADGEDHAKDQSGTEHVRRPSPLWSRESRE